MKVVILALVTLVLASSAAAQPRQPPLPPAAHNTSEPHQDERGTVQSPLVVDIVRAPPNQLETAEQRASRDTQMWLAGAQVVLGIFTVLGLWYARKAALAAKLSADVAKEGLEDLERPFVFVTPAGGAIGLGDVEDPKHGTYIKALPRYELANHGRSPAVVRSVHMRGAMTLNPEVAFAVSEPSPEDTNWLVVCDKPQVKSRDIRILCTEAQHASFKNMPNRSDMLIAGRIEYESVIGTRFERVFCWKHSGGEEKFGEYGGAKYNYDRRIRD